MFIEEIPKNIKPEDKVMIRYDCDGNFEKCEQIQILNYKDAKENFDRNNKKHICEKCEQLFCVCLQNSMKIEV